MSENKEHYNKKYTELPGQGKEPATLNEEDKKAEKNPSEKNLPEENPAEKNLSEENLSEENPAYEDSLEQHYMRFGQRLKYKLRQYKKKTEGMSFGEHVRFFLYYYKWNVIIITALVVCGIILGREIYLNSRPMALGLAILNNEAPEDESLSSLIESDYRSYYSFQSSDRFIILDQLAIDPETYTSEIMATSSSTLTSYESLYYQTTAGNIDVIITDEKGLLYCIEQDLVYPIENFFDSGTTELIEQDVRSYTSYTGEERQYAVDISQSSFVSEWNLGYDDVYLLFPNDTADSVSRAARFIQYIYNN